MNDEKIIDLFFQRDEAAIRQCDAVYGAYCKSIARNILKNEEDCEECLNDAFLSAWKTIPPQKPKNLKLFLAKLVRNKAFDRYREKTAEKRSGGEMELVLNELRESVSAASDTESEFFAHELEQSINAFLRTLEKKERGIFIQRYFFTQTVPQIAEKYSVTPNYVNVALFRTRQKLKIYLITEGFIND